MSDDTGGDGRSSDFGTSGHGPHDWPCAVDDDRRIGVRRLLHGRRRTALHRRQRATAVVRHWRRGHVQRRFLLRPGRNHWPAVGGTVPASRRNGRCDVDVPMVPDRRADVAQFDRVQARERRGRNGTDVPAFGRLLLRAADANARRARITGRGRRRFGRCRSLPALVRRALCAPNRPLRR